MPHFTISPYQNEVIANDSVGEILAWSDVQKLILGEAPEFRFKTFQNMRHSEILYEFRRFTRP